MLRYGLFLHVIITGLILTQITGLESHAQDTVQNSYQDSLYKRILELEKTVAEISKSITVENQEDELKTLLEEADRLSMQQEEQKIDVSKKYFSGVRQQQGLNPNISFGNNLTKI